MMGRGRNRPQLDQGPKAKFRQLTPYLMEHKGALVVAVFLSLIGAGVSLAQPLIVGQIITAVQEGNDVSQIALILVAIILLSGVTSGLMYFVLAKAGEGVVLSAQKSSRLGY